MKLYYLVTDMCNLACPHCIRPVEHSRMQMDGKLAIHYLKVLHEHYPHATLIISGGEPTLYNDFFSILSIALELFDRVAINTNGTTSTLFEDKCSAVLKISKLDVQLSLDGDQQSHDAMRGGGTFDKTIDCIDSLNSLGKRVSVSTIATKSNLESIMRLAKILQKYNVKQWKIDPMMPFGHACSCDEAPSIHEWNAFVDHIISSVSLRLVVKKLFYFEGLKNASQNDIQVLAHSPRSKMLRNCGCVNDKLYIGPDFTVYGCTCLHEYPLGNLIDSSLESILESKNAKLLSCYNVAEDSICASCRFLQLCNSGCIGMSVHTWGKLGYGDGRCPLIREWETKNE